MPKGGQELRKLRERLGLTMREVEQASRRLAQRHRNPRLIISPARLSVMESKNVVPSMYRLYALAQVYGCSVNDILLFYGLR
jgi:transcriptional regulator with XRE-family HTH domain